MKFTEIEFLKMHLAANWAHLLKQMEYMPNVRPN